MEKDVNEISEAWKQTINSDVIKASTEDWEEYPAHVQEIIEAEAKNRGLWEKVLFLRGEKTSEPISKEANLEGYICETCKGTYLNFETGRCARCDLPSEYIGYCIECDKFWPLAPGQFCPEHNVKLSKHKAAMSLLRIGNLFLDAIIFRVLAYTTIFIFAFLLVYLGLVTPSSFENIDPITDWLIGVSLWWLYDFAFEAKWQRSPAKFITGTKVITSTGTKPSAGTIAKRALIRFIPFEPFSFLGNRVYGWHDRWSGTYVIKAKRFEKKKSPKIRQVVAESQMSSSQESRSKLIDSVVPHKNVESCENCEGVIGKLEQAYIFNEHIVCKKCYEQLKKQV